MTPTQSSTEKQSAEQPHLESVIPPPAFIAETLREVKQKPAPRPEDDEILADGAGSDFWKILKRFIEQSQKEVKNNIGLKIGSGTLTMEQLGLQFLSRDLVVDTFQGIVDFVENRANVVELLKIERQKKEAEEAKLKNEPGTTS